ncbi:hypothetical protein RQP46_011376 [Phenoliferia psychrophenolica]
MYPTLLLPILTVLSSTMSSAGAFPIPETGDRIGGPLRQANTGSMAMMGGGIAGFTGENHPSQQWGGGALSTFASASSARYSRLNKRMDKRLVVNPKYVPNPKYTGFTSGLNLDVTHTGQATYFAPGLGACGTYASDTDYIVAASHLIYDYFPGATANPNLNPICGKKIAATYGGNTVIVTVQDECMGCAAWNLDFSPTVFKKLAPLSVGRLDGMTWKFV